MRKISQRKAWALYQAPRNLASMSATTQTVTTQLLNGQAVLGEQCCQFLWEHSNTEDDYKCSLKYVGKLTSPNSRGAWVKMTDWVSFVQWLKQGITTAPDLLVQSSRVVAEDRGWNPDQSFIRVLIGAFGRPFGNHTQRWNAAIEAGILDTRRECQLEMRGTAGIGGQMVGVYEIIPSWQAAMEVLVDARLAAELLATEAERHEAMKEARSAAAKKAAETRRRNAAMRKQKAVA